MCDYDRYLLKLEEQIKKEKRRREMMCRGFYSGTHSDLAKVSEYHPSSVDFRLVLWRQEIKDPRDFTQLGEVGEVGSKKGVESSTARGVESNAKPPIKSRARGEST